MVIIFVFSTSNYTLWNNFFFKWSGTQNEKTTAKVNKAGRGIAEEQSRFRLSNIPKELRTTDKLHSA